MSFLTLQYGQCGNQVGESLYSTIFEDIKNDETSYFNKSLTKWFNVLPNNNYEARSILIDTETKVINDRKETPYAFKNIIAGSFGGGANNWAFGYNVHSHIIKDLMIDKVRLEVEKCDYMLSFLNILSSSGGTGSGVGSRVIEELRDEYPNKLIVNAIVLPYLNGEIVTQNYNTILSLTKLHELSDVEILFENEQIHELCVERVYDSLNFSDLNKLIAFQLASIFQPIGNENNAIFLSHCTSHPLFKYLQIKSSYYNSKHPKFESNQCWRALLNSTTRQTNYGKKLRSNSSVRIQEKNITSLVITRGEDEPDPNDFKALRDPSCYVNWMPTNNWFSYHEMRKICGNNRNITIATNGNSICHYLNSIIEDAWMLFTKKAYLHHYQKFNVGDPEFREAFQLIENVLAGYKHL
ncbi:tubulin delta chain-like [Harmonia axyridis]|uniref:tubulin delta chain-like n=1 Tax=Harmonia axyridis TaxID=115357 RepID=UPI001E277CE6|nr:tubulin delta chain-like [Harmonia axyridis]